VFSVTVGLAWPRRDDRGAACRGRAHPRPEGWADRAVLRLTGSLAFIGQARTGWIATPEVGEVLSEASGSLVGNASLIGKVYFHRELRSCFEAKGYVFRSRSDTEVPLHPYARKGEAMVGDPKRHESALASAKLTETWPRIH
jgi:hypothetical protein